MPEIDAELARDFLQSLINYFEWRLVTASIRLRWGDSPVTESIDPNNIWHNSPAVKLTVQSELVRSINLGSH